MTRSPGALPITHHLPPVQGFETKVEDNGHVLLLRATEIMIAYEAEREELRVDGPGVPLAPNQRLNIVRALLDRVVMPDDTRIVSQRPPLGSEGTAGILEVYSRPASQQLPGTRTYCVTVDSNCGDACRERRGS